MSDQEQSIRHLLYLYAMQKAIHKEACARAAPIIAAAKEIIKEVGERFNVKASKLAMEEDKKKVTKLAAAILPDSRTLVDGIGYIDVTPQPPQAVVIDLDAFLKSGLGRTFVEGVTLTDSTTAYLLDDKTVPGVMLADIPPRVRISVKEYEDGLEEKDE